MKNDIIQKEVLVIMNSSFAKKHWCKPEDESGVHLSAQENAEENSVNDFIQELIPEEVFSAKKDHKIFLWQVHQGFSFVQFELGDLPAALEKKHSIDPHNFLKETLLN